MFCVEFRVLFHHASIPRPTRVREGERGGAVVRAAGTDRLGGGSQGGGQWREGGAAELRQCRVTVLNLAGGAI